MAGPGRFRTDLAAGLLAWLTGSGRVGWLWLAVWGSPPGASYDPEPTPSGVQDGQELMLERSTPLGGKKICIC